MAMPVRTVTCKGCGKVTKHHGRGFCYTCYSKDYRKRNKDKIREYDSTGRNRTKVNQRSRRYRTNNPIKIHSHNLVNKAIREGILIKPERCEICLKYGKIYGHHPDYSKPLEVEWLCCGCHRNLHSLEYEPWNKGKTGVYSKETLIKMSKSHGGMKWTTII